MKAATQFVLIVRETPPQPSPFRESAEMGRESLANTFLRMCGGCGELTPHYAHETFIECAVCRRRTFKATVMKDEG
jgi:NADH pyrophosphatase NudC (nudix superfamily)